MAAQAPIALLSFGPGANEEVITASEQAAIKAPPRPCAARAAIRVVRSFAIPPANEARPNRSRASTNILRCPKWSAARPPSIKKPAKVIA